MLHDLEKEIEKETNLTPQEKESLQKELQETSGRFDKLKSEVAKYTGKALGHGLRSFVGMPDD
jgi:hypothetical protein